MGPTFCSCDIFRSLIPRLCSFITLLLAIGQKSIYVLYAEQEPSLNRQANFSHSTDSNLTDICVFSMKLYSVLHHMTVGHNNLRWQANGI